jgi:hypothetical protein
MKRTVLLLSTLAGAFAVAGCIAVPVESHRPVVVRQGPPTVVYQGQPPVRGYRDNDRDGVPDRYDRRPNNPYRN